MHSKQASQHLDKKSYDRATSMTGACLSAVLTWLSASGCLFTSLVCGATLCCLSRGAANLPLMAPADYLQRAPEGSMFRESWPSLFIGPPHTFSSLHVDSFGSNFWMGLVCGRKRWTFYKPSDIPCLYPTWSGEEGGSLDPTFGVDPSKPASAQMQQYPLFGMAQPTQCVLEPGEVLFVPAGAWGSWWRGCLAHAESCIPHRLASLCGEFGRGDHCHLGELCTHNQSTA